jgi:hypothetical protein
MTWQTGLEAEKRAGADRHFLAMPEMAPIPLPVEERYLLEYFLVSRSDPAIALFRAATIDVSANFN